MRAAAVLVSCGLLAGCAGAPWAGGFRVNVPVETECKTTVPNRPTMPTEGLAAGVDTFTFVTHAQAEIELRESYEGELRAALARCLNAP